MCHYAETSMHGLVCQPDFITDDDDKHLPLDEEYIADTTIPMRHSQDNKVDERGKRLLDICISARLRILNGRTFGDSNGNFTCFKPNGSSVVDYFIMSEELLSEVLYFHVHPFWGTFSDCHCKISTTLMLPHSPEISMGQMHPVPPQFVWNKSSRDRFRRALQEPSAKLNLQTDTHGGTYSSQEDVNGLVSRFEDILLNAAQSCLKIKTVKKRRQHKKWYDGELYIKKNELLHKGKQMTLKPYNKEIRNSYYKTYREYTKLRKYKKKHFKQSILNKLDSLEKEDPKTYWNLVNSLKEEQKSSPESSIDSDTWIDYFASLNSVNLHHVERVNALNEMVKNLENNKTFSELDSRITIEEIKIAISSLKTNKAAGLDRISNEMIKAAGELIIPYLHKMFNTIFSSGQYPNSWASAYIKPLLKKGDPKLPENYRGIAINPSIAKLFNLILNKRLDKFLTDKNCIDSCQIGFSKNARTSDHMFVLKCLIDKCLILSKQDVYMFY